MTGFTLHDVLPPPPHLYLCIHLPSQYPNRATCLYLPSHHSNLPTKSYVPPPITILTFFYRLPLLYLCNYSTSHYNIPTSRDALLYPHPSEYSNPCKYHVPPRISIPHLSTVSYHNPLTLPYIYNVHASKNSFTTTTPLTQHLPV